MNQSEDKPLQETLSRWKVGASLPPRFQQDVWRRIERSQATSVSVGELWRQWLEGLFARRGFALSYLTALLMIGLVAGYWQARSEQRQAQTQLAERYVRSVAAFQTLQ